MSKKRTCKQLANDRRLKENHKRAKQIQRKEGGTYKKALSKAMKK